MWCNVFFNTDTQNSTTICKSIFKRLKRKFVSNFLNPPPMKKKSWRRFCKLGNTKLECVVWCCQGLLDV
jgi:hypothetical protein